MHHRLNQAIALVGLHLAHHAKVEIGQPAIGHGQQVAGVGVGVEEAMLQQLPEGALHPHIDQVGGVDAQALELVDIGQLGALNPLHGQYPAGRVVGINFGHVDVGDVAVEVGKPLGILALVGVVHLLKDALAKFVHDGDQVAANLADAIGGKTGQTPNDVEIEGNALGQTGTLHLNGDGFATVQPAFVHLTQGGSGHGAGGNFSVDLIGGRTQLFFDKAVGDFVGKGRNLILEGGQFF